MQSFNAEKEKWQHCSSACLPGCAISATVAVVSAMLAATFAKNGALCQPLLPGRRKPVSASLVIQLSPHLPGYVLAKFSLV
jgi:hypothetical protein